MRGPVAEPGGLQTGKLSSAMLQSVVLARTGARRREVLVRAGVGLDSAALDFGGDLVILSTDPITGAAGDAGYWAVHICCNDVAVYGADPVALLLTVLMPEGTSAEELSALAAGSHRAALELNIEIAGGHTEVTRAVNTAVLSATAIGRVPPDRLITPAGARAGDLLLLTKGAGIEGTSILAEAFRDRLLAAGVSMETITSAVAMRNELSVVHDAAVARVGRPTAMHDPTEGGVLGAAYELAEASGLGFVLQASDVPVRAETAALAAVLGFDSLRLISSGALMIAAGPENAETITAGLAGAGIACAVIGRMTAAAEGRTVIPLQGGRPIAVKDTPRDELWRLLDQA